MRPPFTRLRHLDSGAAPDSLHGDRQNLVVAVGRVVPLTCEESSDLVIGHALVNEIKHPVAHFHSSRQLGDRVHFYLRKVSHRAAAPDDSDQSDIMFAAVEHDLIDETPQQRLALSVSRGLVRPDLR